VTLSIIVLLANGEPEEQILNEIKNGDFNYFLMEQPKKQG
jgi:hypothetical protein